MRQPRQLPWVKIRNSKKERGGDISGVKIKITAKSQILFTLQISLSKFGGSEQL